MQLARLLVAAALLPLCAAAADEARPVTISEGFGFAEKDGESLYRAICQGCHMSRGEGAQGAGLYPALAANPRLAAPKYAPLTILRGRRGMPPLRQMLSDEQIAEVTNYVRTHMGNDYTDAVTAADVKSLR